MNSQSPSSSQVGSNERRRDESPVRVIELLTFAEVKKSRPKVIWYSTGTMWWTHRASDLGVLPNGIPCDPRGAPLMMTDRSRQAARAFLDGAAAKPEHYGRHGLRAFMAMHHANSYHVDDLVHWASGSIEEYNKALDMLDGFPLSPETNDAE